ncbi:MAG: InlB B-repeat-containing protein [Clostridia bacterium]|nr:InlB B-repeat-containing protein [Clostridia bacterium]
MRNNTKRKSLSILLALGLAIGIALSSPQPVAADDGPTHTHDGITFTAWTAADSLPTNAGNYYLTTDVMLGETWVCDKNINLCLNGRGITLTNAYAYNRQSVIRIKEGGVLSIYDCGTAAEHKYDVDANLQAKVNDETGTETFTGGYIHSDRNRILWISGGTFNLYAGTIIGGITTDGNDGAGIVVGSYATQDQTNEFNMYGGCICNNYSARHAGGVRVDYGTFTMYGGSIERNKAAEFCGGVYVSGEGTFRMTGGSIEGNTASYGGGVYVSNYQNPCNFKISGNPVIAGNTDNAGKSDVSLVNGAQIELQGAVNMDPVNVTLGNYSSNNDTHSLSTGVFTSGCAIYIDSSKPLREIFISDADGYTVAAVPDGGNAGEAQLVESFTLTLNANDGENTPETLTLKYPKNLAETLIDNPFTRSGYTFAGWNTQQDGNGNSFANKSSITLSENTTLYAQWTVSETGGKSSHRHKSSYAATPAATMPVKVSSGTLQLEVAVSGSVAAISPLSEVQLSEIARSEEPVVFDLTSLGTGIKKINLPADTFKKLAEVLNEGSDSAGKAVTFRTADGSVTFDMVALQAIAAGADSDMVTLDFTLTELGALSNSQQSVLEGKQAVLSFSLALFSGNKEISGSGNGTITVAIPLTAADNQTGRSYAGYSMAANGTLSGMATRYTDETLYMDIPF